MFEISYNRALNIQRAQMRWYRLPYPVVKYVRKKTLPCPADIHPDEPIGIFLANRLVPRGGWLERFRKYRQFKGTREDRRFKGDINYAHELNVELAWNERMKEGRI